MSFAHDNVKARYRRITQKNEHKLLGAKKALYAKLPELKKLDDEILSANLDMMGVALGVGGKQKRTELQQAREALTKKREKLLKQNGLEVDALNITYDCTLCNDTGVNLNGSRCSCYNRYLLEERLKNSGLNDNAGSFETFRADVFSEDKANEKISQRAYMLALKERCETFANNALKTDIKNLVLMGNAGTGKTFLAEAVVNRVLSNGNIALYTTAGRLFSQFHNHRLGEAIDLELYYDVPLMALDDLGTEVMTKNVTIEYFYNLINERQTRGKATVIATNLDPQGFKNRYGDRIYSRMFSKQSAKYLIPITHGDIRK